jgi:hypothetical protein
VDGLLPGAIWVSENSIERDAKAPDVANPDEHDHPGREQFRVYRENIVEHGSFGPVSTTEPKRAGSLELRFAP